jgi:hypothetical protein
MIAVNDETGTKAIYCHFDGYLENVGMKLLNNWNTPELVSQLMELGDLSSLGTEIGEKQDFDLPTNRDWCLAYGRDRNEKGTEAGTFHSLFYAEGTHKAVDYFYVFENGEWSFKRNGYKFGYSSLREYAEELAQK